MNSGELLSGDRVLVHSARATYEVAKVISVDREKGTAALLLTDNSTAEFEAKFILKKF